MARFLFLTILLHCSVLVAQEDPALEKRVHDLSSELRCLVCQNQTIADSNAPLAIDLRQQIRAQIAQGRSDGEIRDYMVQRYGDFVLYRPPLKGSTILLWAGPFAFLVLGFYLLLRFLRRRRIAAPQLSDAERSRAARLLE